MLLEIYNGRKIVILAAPDYLYIPFDIYFFLYCQRQTNVVNIIYIYIYIYIWMTLYMVYTPFGNSIYCFFRPTYLYAIILLYY
ncbi:hypothetical protein [Plasmodium yoelii yoelii]|uniref:Uncharacterized protein n=1 Tax=Plasmodium yoelii yoelii TaxID=73239 RepID=Q7RFR1_PLAYO|nr:hypothetical protein [Plasmodium yoelii yoelii]